MQSASHGVVLVVGPDNRAHADLRALLNLAGYYALTGRTVRQSIGLLSAVSVVICEHTLPDGTWKDLLAALDRVHSPPALVVTSVAVEPRLWAESPMELPEKGQRCALMGTHRHAASENPRIFTLESPH